MGKREAEAHHLPSGQDHWHRNLKWWNDFINQNMIIEEWKENFRMSERSFFILHGKVNMYDVINNPYHLILSL